MTDLNNSHASDKRPTHGGDRLPHSAGEESDPSQDFGRIIPESAISRGQDCESTTDAGSRHVDESRDDHRDVHDDDAWESFATAHANELRDIERSRSARRFERHATRSREKARISVDDLQDGVFVDGVRGQGPRDFSGSSWLDTDRIMDRYGDDFVPPNPSLGHIQASSLMFWTLFIVGVVGLIASLFAPSLIRVLATVFAFCALIGGAGLVTQLRGHDSQRNGYTDDGARV